MDYRDSHKKEGKGAEYDQSFFKSNYKNYMYRWEREVLQKELEIHQPESYLDFACGTARITRIAEDQVDDITGIDVSSSMLDVARKVLPKATFIETDITSPTFTHEKKYDLVSSFRFFTNAQDELRKEVLDSLSPLMEEGATFIFNLHMNSTSAFAMMARVYEFIFGKREGFNHLNLNHMVKNLKLTDHFKIEKTYAKGVLPIIREEKSHSTFFFKVIETIERLFSIMPGYKYFCKYQIIVCTKK